MKDKQRRVSITGVPEEENQNHDTELLFKTIIQESFLEMKEDLNLHIFHTRKNQPRMINSETYPSKTMILKAMKKSSGPSGKKGELLISKARGLQ